MQQADLPAGDGGQPRAKDFRKGIAVAVFSGIMSSCFAYGLDAGNPIRRLRLAHGTDWYSPPLAPTAVWGCGQVRTFSNQTVRQVVRLEAGGERGAAIPLGQALVSDPVDLKVRRFQELAISVYYPGEVAPAGHLAQLASDRSWVIINSGISGNRLLRDGAGPKALARFGRDALDIMGARAILLLEGINDIGDAFIPGGVGEKVREEVNAWIRKGQGFDGVVDFDAALRDPLSPLHFRGAEQCGDDLHPNDAGYHAMAEAAFRRLFAAGGI